MGDASCKLKATCNDEANCSSGSRVKGWRCPHPTFITVHPWIEYVPFIYLLFFNFSFLFVGPSRAVVHLEVAVEDLLKEAEAREVPALRRNQNERQY